jgi:small subunit ribosomal protein S4
MPTAEEKESVIMARYTEAVCRHCRREKQKLFLKGDRCYGPKCAMNTRAYAPGMHGQSRKKLSEYGMQLREKQKARRFYGVLENQFEHYFDLATKIKGQTGENLLSLLERRLDNVVYRLGFAMSRPEARQLVSHRHFTVNGRIVNIPSFLVKPGDVIALKTASRSSSKLKGNIEANASRPAPKWLDLARENYQATVVALPARDDIDLPVEEQRIVELYSK